MKNNKFSKLAAIVLTFVLLMPVQLISAAGSVGSSGVESVATGESISAKVEAPQFKNEVAADYTGHWAEQDFQIWVDKGLISGYGKNMYKPDQNITRAELITLLNRAFNFETESGLAFTDVLVTSSYYKEVQTAVAAGYVSGYIDGTIRPANTITRQEAAVMLFRLFQLDPSLGNSSTLKDIKELPDWSRAAIQTLVNEKYVSGYSDGNFKATKLLTRAEALRMIDQLSGGILNQEGTYSPSTGRNLIINQQNITLANTLIEGNLYLTEGIGEGNVTLDNVTVKGKIIVNGGGENSIVMNDSHASQLMVNKKNGKVRILVKGTSVIDLAQLDSGGKLEEDTSLTGTGFSKIVIAESLAGAAGVQLSGSFGQIDVQTLAKAVIHLEKGSIAQLTLHHAATLQVDENAEIRDLIPQSKESVEITGKGKVIFDPLYASQIKWDTPAPTASAVVNVPVQTGSSATQTPEPTSSPTATATPISTPEPTATPTEQAPVFTNVSVHDPSLIKDKGTYYVFGSHLGAAKTTDLMNWTLIDSGVSANNKLFKSDTSDVTIELAEALAWAQTDTLWAADVIQLADGKYYMYYNACEGSQPLSAMGLAVADNIEGPYKDVGIFLKSGGVDYDATVKPNVVDPDAFFDKDGKLWMVYGSYSGGIFILEMNPETGFPIEGQGNGKHLLGQNHSRIEAPTINYNPETGYYYLYVTFGGLDASGGYNMRVSRSLNPDGPYVDYEGQDMINAQGPAGSFFDDAAIAPYGVKLFGNFLFSNLNAEADFPTYGYVSAGHNSVYYEPENGKTFNVFHSRFPFRGENHEVRVHQMFMNEDGWPVVAPHRYAGETIGKVASSDIAGAYQFINHGKDITPDIKPTVYVELLADGTIAGSLTGTWELTGDYYANLHINEVVDGVNVENTYKGVFLRQWDSTRQVNVMTFSALSGAGIAIWGSQIETLSDQQRVVNTANILSIGDTSRVYSDLVLPLKAAHDAAISWASSNEEVLTAAGKVTRPVSGGGDAAVQLTATITLGSATATKTFTVVVIQQSSSVLEDGLVAAFDFEGNLQESTDRVAAGTITGNLLNNSGGTISYGEGQGATGQAAVFNGESGVRLADGLIKGNSYTVSMWLNPEQLSVYTTAFFGAKSQDSWISLVPAGTPALSESMLWSGSNSANAGMQIETGKWTHMAFTYDKGTVTLYVNGVQKYTGTGFTDVFEGNDGIFGLGVNYWDTPYKGKLDGLRIYEKALSPELIDWLMNGQPDTNIKVNHISLGLTTKQLALGKSFTPSVTMSPGNAGNKTLVWSSNEPAIAEVNPSTGEITGMALGQTVITAAAADGGGATVSYTVNVTDGVVAEYTFDGNLTDNLGRVGDGQIIGSKLDNPTGGAITYVDGISGEAAQFDGASGIRLPDGLIDSYEYSVSMWLNPAQLTKYTTAFFGATTADSWISLLPLGGTNKTMLWSGTAWFDAAAGLTIPTGKWSHVAFTVDKGAVKLYVNGGLAYSGSEFPDIFKDKNAVFGLGVNYWDSPFKGMMDELKIYSRALSAEQINTEFAAGNIVLLNESSKSLIIGQSVSLTANQEVSWSSSDDNVATVVDGLVTAIGAGTAVITATSVSEPTKSATATIQVTATEPEFDPAADLLLLLDFNGDVKDSSGQQNDATVRNNRVEYVNGRSDGQQAAQFLQASTGSAFDNIPVVLPNNLIDGDQAYTVTAWVYWNGVEDNWAQTFSSIYFSDTFVAEDTTLNYYLNLGLNGETHLFLSNPTVVSNNPLPVKAWAHVAMTVNPEGDTILYLNGIEIARAPSVTRTTQGFNEHFLGGNFWDQNFNGLMDEFRMYDKALSAENIAELAGM